MKLGDDHRNMFHWYSVWKIMRKLTNKQIEKRAVMELITYFEKQVEKVIIQSKIELSKLNRAKRSQGIYQKTRIDKDCIVNAIKTINSNEHSSLP